MANEVTDTVSLFTDAAVILPVESTSENSAFSQLRNARTILEQIHAAVSTKVVSTDPKDYPVIHDKKGKKYMMEQFLDKHVRRSWISNHGHWLVQINDAHKIIGSYWCCGSCGSLSISQSTSSAATHLDKSHKIQVTNSGSPTGPSTLPTRKRAATTISELLRAGTVKKPRDPILKTQGDLFRHTFVSWMIFLSL